MKITANELMEHIIFSNKLSVEIGRALAQGRGDEARSMTRDKDVVIERIKEAVG